MTEGGRHRRPQRAPSDGRRYRGIDGALEILRQVGEGAFASEAIRKTSAQIEPNERPLAALLVYSTLRKLGLWKNILAKFCRRPVESLSPRTRAIFTTAIAGVLEIKNFRQGAMVNAAVQLAKESGEDEEAERTAALVNAVLRTVIREAPAYIAELRASSAMRDLAMACGVPGWAAAALNEDYGLPTAKQLVKLNDTDAFLSARLAPDVDRDAWIAERAQRRDDASAGVFDRSVRMSSNPFPPDLPGYADGEVSPQSESSMWAVEELLAALRDGHTRVLDMCCGRGVKAGHILTSRPDISLEAWELSEARLSAARADLDRLGVVGRVDAICGDARCLEPKERPHAILLDAPCSGSGTWRRHPEAKWRTSPESVRSSARLQTELFARAMDLLVPGGILMYSTCSIFRDENERAIGAVMSSRADAVELPLRRSGAFTVHRGRPYGHLLFPEDPWTDGFYIAIFRKKS